MSCLHRTIFLATATVACWAQAPQIDPMLNRTKDPPDVYTIGLVNGAKVLFRVAFFPYDSRFTIYQVPILLTPAPADTVPASVSPEPRLVGPFDPENFPPVLVPLPPPPPKIRKDLRTHDASNAPPDQELLQTNPWELPDPIDNFVFPPPPFPTPFDDPFFNAPVPPQSPGDQIPWVDYSNGALNLASSAQPIGYVAKPSSNQEPHVTTLKATSISIGPSPAGIVISRDLNTAYIAVSGASQVAVVDMAANKVTSTIDIPGSKPYSLALAPDNQTLYVADAAGVGSLHAIDIAAGTVKQIPIAVFYATSIVLTPDATRLWICNNNNSDVSVMDVLTNTIVAHLPVQYPWAVAFNATGTHAYISSSPPGPNGTVEVYDANSYIKIASVQVGSTPRSVAVTPSGRHVFVVNSTAQGTITQISTATNSIIRTFAVGGNPSGLAMEY